MPIPDYTKDQFTQLVSVSRSYTDLCKLVGISSGALSLLRKRLKLLGVEAPHLEARCATSVSDAVALSTRRDEHNADRLKKLRQFPDNRARFLVRDAKCDDRRRGFFNDLTEDYVKGILSSNACSYCECGTDLTLDRIDNALGHTQKNVVISCRECNYIRKDMPYLAWICLVPGVREAKSKDLFGSWSADPFKRGKTTPNEAGSRRWAKKHASVAQG